ncbi:MAG: hypothetical protein OXP08_03535 [bacterium]|nr:hypothetical protein [bacterium]
MKFSASMPATTPRSALHPAAILAIAAALFILANSATYAQTAPPAAPALTARTTENGILLTWQAAPGAVRYELLTWWTAAAAWQPIGGDNLTGTVYTHTGATAGVTYHYSIRAVYADGRTSAWLTDYPTATALSAIGASTATPSPTSTPGPTPTPTATASTSAELAVPQLTAQTTAAGILLTWETVPGAVRYELLAYRDASAGWQPIGGANLTGTSYTHSGAVAGAAYFYSIRAVNAAGQTSAWLTDYPTATAPAATDPATATPTPTPTSTPGPTATPTATASTSAPAVPNLTAQATTDGILLTWETVPGAVRYELLAYRDAAAGWQPIGGDDLTGTSYTHSGATAGAAYFYSIRAVNAAGQTSAWLTDYPTATAPSVTDSGTATPTSTATAAGTPTPTPTVATTERGALIALYEATGGANWYRSDNWLSDAPLDSWYGVTAEGRAEHVTRLVLGHNNLKGTLPDLRALANLKKLWLGSNFLHGPLPDLSGLAELADLSLHRNELSGPLPDLSLLFKLRRIELYDNRLRGPVFDLHRLTNLWGLRLENNDLSGPLPDANAFVTLQRLDLSGNRFCLPPGVSLSHDYPNVDANLKSLNLPECTAADLAAYPAAPANLTASVAGSRVTLSWDAVAAASSYDLWVWDSLDRIWGPAAGSLTGTSYSHPVLTDGRNYYFQVRSRDAAGARGPWSDRAHVIVVSQRYPPPPPSLELNIFYQKYLKVLGVIVTAPSEVSDEMMARAREIVTGMYAGRPAYFEEISDNLIRIVLFKLGDNGEGLSQLPETGHLPYFTTGLYFRPFSKRKVAAAWDGDDDCYAFIHEFAHAIHSAIRDAPGGQAFNARLDALHEAALDAGLWRGAYASWSYPEYWAESVTFWFHEFIETYTEAHGMKLEDYDPEIAKLIAETFTENAYVPAYCKPDR